jgi:chromosome segregation ATPase
MENQVLTPEEIQKIQEIQENYQQLIIELGEIQLQKINLKKEQESLDERENKAHKDLDRLSQEDKDLASSLSEKYGVGVIDLEKGIISKN